MTLPTDLQPGNRQETPCGRQHGLFTVTGALCYKACSVRTLETGIYVEACITIFVTLS